jgi:hypothetical protein
LSFDSIALPCEGYKGFAGEMLGAEQGVCIQRKGNKNNHSCKECMMESIPQERKP